MTPPPIPPREPPEAPELRDDALEQALFAQELLPAPPALARRVTDALAPRARPVLSLRAVARLAAAVVLAIGTWVAAFGGLPTLAHAQPSPLVEEVLAPARELLPAPPEALAAATLEEAPTADDAVVALLLGLVGTALVAAGIVLARRPAKEDPS